MTACLSNAAAEKALCACVLAKEDCFDAVADQVTAAHFSIPQCATLWRRFSELRNSGQPIDAVTVGHASLVAVVKQQSHTLANLSSYAATVVTLARARKVLSAAERIVSQASSVEDANTEGFIDTALAAVFDAATTGQITDTLEHVKPAVAGALKKLDHMRQSGKRSGMPTGFEGCDMYTGGLHETELTLIAARPGVGKTSYALQQAIALAKAGFTVLFCSLEMGRIELLNRALSMLSNIDLTKIRMGAINMDERDRLAKAAVELEELPLFFDDNPGLTLLGMRAKIRRVNAKVVIVDYLQLIPGDPQQVKQGRNVEVGGISRGLKRMAKELNVAVVALAQLNRDVEGRGEYAAPRLSDLRESGSLEQDADNICFLYPTGPEEPGPEVPTDWLLAKQRNGPVGNVALRFERKYTRYAV